MCYNNLLQRILHFLFQYSNRLCNIGEHLYFKVETERWEHIKTGRETWKKTKTVTSHWEIKKKMHLLETTQRRIFIFFLLYLSEDRLGPESMVQGLWSRFFILSFFPSFLPIILKAVRCTKCFKIMYDICNKFNLLMIWLK